MTDLPARSLIQPGTPPAPLVRIGWWVFVGWWASYLATFLAYGAALVWVSRPLVPTIVAMLPRVVSLDRASVEGDAPELSLRHPIGSLLWLLLFGWWLGASVAMIAWLCVVTVWPMQFGQRLLLWLPRVVWMPSVGTSNPGDAPSPVAATAGTNAPGGLSPAPSTTTPTVAPVPAAKLGRMDMWTFKAEYERSNGGRIEKGHFECTKCGRWASVDEAARARGAVVLQDLQIDSTTWSRIGGLAAKEPLRPATLQRKLKWPFERANAFLGAAEGLQLMRPVHGGLAPSATLCATCVSVGASSFRHAETMNRVRAAQQSPWSSAGDAVPPGLRFDVLQRDGFRCTSCGRDTRSDGATLQVVPIVPIDAGGQLVPVNLLTRCEHCLDTPDEARPVREPISAALRAAVLKRDNFTCRYCGSGADTPGIRFEIDHLVPVAQGGPTVIDNLVTACASCNRGKSAKGVLA